MSQPKQVETREAVYKRDRERAARERIALERERRAVKYPEGHPDIARYREEKAKRGLS